MDGETLLMLTTCASVEPVEGMRAAYSEAAAVSAEAGIWDKPTTDTNS